MNKQIKQFLIALTTFTFLSCGTNDNSNETPPDLGSNCPEKILTYADRINTSFSNQADLDAFGLMGYTDVQQDIYLLNGIYDLSPLQCLKSATSITIESDDLTNLRGLENLKNVGIIAINNTSFIKNFEGLTSLKTTDAIYAFNNDSLINFIGLNGLESVSSIFIHQNNSLKSLDGFESLTTNNQLNHNGTATGRIIIDYNPVLTSISGLQNISGLMVELNLSHNPLLTDFGYFERVTEMNSIVIYECNGLVDYNSFPNLIDIFAVIISHCENFESLEFSTIERMGILELTYNPKFNSLSGLSSLKDLYYNDRNINMRIDNLPALSTLNGLENLEHNGNRISITSDGPNSLNDICALRTLVSNYLAQGSTFPVQNSIYIATNCSSSVNLLLDFENLCHCN